MSTRLERFLSGIGGGVAIVHKPENMRYLSGFLGEGALVVSESKSAIITDFRYVEAAQRQSPGWEILSVGGDITQNKLIADCVRQAGGTALWEEDYLTIQEGRELARLLGGQEPKSLNGLPERLRIIKDEQEIAAMQRAAAITDDAFTHLLTWLKPGVTERQAALELFVYMLGHGAQDLSFSTIAASGENASLPHAIPSDRVIREGDVVTFDFGCKVDDYCSDFTRTVAIGKIDPKLQEIYQIVLEANLRALDALHAGKTGREMDSVARDIIAKAGYGDCFGHSLGHGVGRLIHEEPRLSQRSDTVLEPGMAVTIEPGIYLPGLGGVRIEDLCVVEQDGHRNLCRSSKELITL